MTDAGVGMLAGLLVNADALSVTQDTGKKDGMCLPEFESILSNAQKTFEMASSGNRSTASQSSGTPKNSVETTFGDKEVKSADNSTSNSKKLFEKKVITDAEESPEVEEQDVSVVLLQYQTLLREVVADGFGITPKQLDEAMELQGMTMTDLLDVSSLAQLFQSIQEDFAMTDVIVNQEFLGTMQAISDLTMETLEEVNLPLDEFLIQFEEFTVEANVNPGMAMDSELMTNAEPVVETVVEAVEETAKTEPVIIQAQTDSVVEKTVLPDENTVEEQMDLVDAEEEIVPSVNLEVQDEDGENEELDTKEEPELEMSTEKKESDKGEHAIEGHQPKVMLDSLQMTNNSPVQNAESVKIVELHNLVSELTEYLQLQSSGTDISSIEMQLSPANLGKIVVEVTSNNGEVSAKIATQTEAAKEALEASVSQLRNNLEEQGVKVSAVEVTVSAHEFEQNLQEGGSKEQQQLEKELQEKYQRRDLNLREMSLDDLQGLMSEEDMVVAKMMKDNGNVINIGA